VVRHEEELLVEAAPVEIGSVHVRKRIEREHVKHVTTREVEEADVERRAVQGEDSGQIETLPDGSVSIPVFEEELVVTKRLVVRERIIIRKHTRTHDQVVRSTLRRERVDVDADSEDLLEQGTDQPTD
jgi:uncharacterized protein (TIGR02271 family)